MQERRAAIVIQGGTVVTSTGTLAASVAISGERIVAVGETAAMPPADRYIDATGKQVFPGAIDCHVHLGVDDWATATRAAALSGLTTVIPFVSYNAAVGETLPAAIARHRQAIAEHALVDVSLNFILSNTPYVFETIPESVERGVSAYKMFMTYKRWGTLMSPDGAIAEAMTVIARAGGLMQLHCENGEVLDYLQARAVAEGRTHPRDFPATCPAWAEAEAINRAVLLGEMTGCPTYVVHLSTREGLERIRRAQNEGLPVWTETCPQYLLLDETEMERHGPYAKIGPPLRPDDRVNQEALWEGLRLGQIANVGSDHSPAAKERKEPGWSNVFFAPDGSTVPFGAPSLETLVPLMYSEGVVKRGLSPAWFARALAENPARTFGLYPRKGVIQPGSDADLLIVDPEATWQVRAADQASNAGYTLYEGWRVRGRPWMTLLRGRILLNEGRLEQSPGSGAFVPAGPPRPPVVGAAG